jgi:hypothetical protein
MDNCNSDATSENVEKSLVLATALFPDETWISIENNIWVAKSRLIQKEREPKKWDKEMSQVRILTSRGSVAYFLPESLVQGEIGNRCADLVLDGVVMEMKTITGARATLGGKFKQGYKQGALLLKNNLDEKNDGKLSKKHSVFIRLFSDLSVGSVKAQAAGVLKCRYDDGSFICYFEKLKELRVWTYEELRSIIGK